MSVQSDLEFSTGRSLLGESDQLAGQRLRSLRRSSQYSMQRLADELGITYQQVGKYEFGQNRISVVRLKQICAIFDVPISYFVGDTGLSNKTPLDRDRNRQYMALSDYFHRISKKSDRDLVISLAKALNPKASK